MKSFNLINNNKLAKDIKNLKSAFKKSNYTNRTIGRKLYLLCLRNSSSLSCKNILKKANLTKDQLFGNVKKIPLSHEEKKIIARIRFNNERIEFQAKEAEFYTKQAGVVQC